MKQVTIYDFPDSQECMDCDFGKFIELDGNSEYVCLRNYLKDYPCSLKTEGESLLYYQKQQFEGIDASLEISLFEYGLIWKKEFGYDFVYGVEINRKGKFIKFERSDLDETVLTESFIDISKVAKYTGLSVKNFKDRPFPEIVFDLVSYYGTDNVFGIAYNPFEIKKEEL